MEEKILRYLKGEATDVETRELEAWMEASEENKEKVHQVCLNYWATDIALAASALDYNKALDRLHERINKQNKDRYRTRRFYNHLWKGWQWTAAVLFIPFLLCSLYFYHSSLMKQDVGINRMVEVRTKPGMTASVLLPDSTIVFLNSSSILRYPLQFGDNREVLLNGEAFFAVKREKGQKFMVNTLNNSKITVYGTEFNVEAYQEDEILSATLLSGSIGFSYGQTGKQKTLMISPGQKALYNMHTGKVVLKKANVEVETSWKDGRLVFKNTPLKDALRMLGKKYGVKFSICNNVLLGSSFTGVFTNQSLAEVLQRFQVSSNMKFYFVEQKDTDEIKYINVY